MKLRDKSMGYYNRIAPKGVTVQCRAERYAIVKFTINSKELDDDWTVYRVKEYLKRHQVLGIYFEYEVI